MSDFNDIDIKLGNLPLSILEKVAPVLRERGEKIQGQAKLLAPVDTGQLSNSIEENQEISGFEITETVRTNVEYAIYQEFGTGKRGEQSPSPPKSTEKVSYSADWEGISATPFLSPAYRELKDSVIDMVKQAVKDALKG